MTHWPVTPRQTDSVSDPVLLRFHTHKGAVSLHTMLLYDRLAMCQASLPERVNCRAQAPERLLGRGWLSLCCFCCFLCRICCCMACLGVSTAAILLRKGRDSSTCCRFLLQDVLLYGLPEHAYFYPELLNLLEEGSASGGASGSAHATVTALYCK